MNEKDRQWVIDEIKNRKENIPFQLFDCPVCRHTTLSRNISENSMYILYSIPSGKIQCFTCGKVFYKKETWEEVKQ